MHVILLKIFLNSITSQACNNWCDLGNFALITLDSLLDFIKNKLLISVEKCVDIIVMIALISNLDNYDCEKIYEIPNNEFKYSG